MIIGRLEAFPETRTVSSERARASKHIPRLYKKKQTLTVTEKTNDLRLLLNQFEAIRKSIQCKKVGGMLHIRCLHNSHFVTYF